MTDPQAATSDGSPVIDPTKNVLDLVAAAIQRQDDLRDADSRHIRELMAVRELHAAEMRVAEAARIDAIRSVDVGAVQRAAEVSAQQASTLAAQVAVQAEAVRVSLAAAMEPIQRDIADLRCAQYEAQGIKSNVVERKSDAGLMLMLIGTMIAGIGVIVAVLLSGG